MKCHTLNTGRPGIFQLLLPYWTSRESWKGWMLLIIQLILMFTSVYIMVWANELQGKAVDNMIGAQWGALKISLSSWIAVSFASLVLTILGAYVVNELLTYEWRTFLTRWYLNKWTSQHAYYGIERDGLVDNPDQRISEDINTFISLSLSIFLQPIQAIVEAVSFTVVLWNISGSLEFGLWGYDISIAGYLVYVVYIYSIVEFLITHYFGKELIYLFNRRKSVEADFRYAGVQLRDNAEQIAFYRGDDIEKARLNNAFENVRFNWRGIIIRQIKMSLAKSVYSQVGTFLPLLAALPRLFVGAITYGDVTRIQSAFQSIHGSLSIFSQAYVGIAEWLAVNNRLRDLSESINVLYHQTSDIRLSEDDQKKHIVIPSLTLKKPDGTTLSAIQSIDIKPGDRWLIQGVSGCGKSTLLRAIAGLWPYGHGEIHRPDNKEIFFLPQRSYVPWGTLRMALSYPSDEGRFSTEELTQALKDVELSALIPRLYDTDRWQQKLSGGEQQRLAIARVLLHKPAFILVDEATSALDPVLEKKLYTFLTERLSSSAIVSVAHRVSLTEFHDHFLVLNPAISAKLTQPSTIQSHEKKYV